MLRDRTVTVLRNPAYDITATYPILGILPPAIHPAPVSKYRLVYQACKRLPVKLKRARRVTRQELLLAHDEGYVKEVFNLAAAGLVLAAVAVYLGSTEAIDSDCLPLNRAVLEMHVTACGGTLQAAQQVASGGGIAVNLHGGFHHAHRGRGAGFCFFNDLAIAAAWLARHRKKVLIVDADVHAGDGTAAIVNGLPPRLRRRIKTLSAHMRDGYPDARPPSDYQHEFATGVDDNRYLRVFRRLLVRALAETQPDVVLYQAGVDPLESDRLGLMALTPEGLMQRDRHVLESCMKRSIGVVVTLGGGYSETETTAAAHINTIRSAIESADNKFIVAKSREPMPPSPLQHRQTAAPPR